MSRSPMYDPQTSEARSAWIAGLTEICNKLSGVLNMKTSSFEDLTLPELYISEEDRFRIYQAPLGNKLWLQTPAPVFKKNGNVITPNANNFEIDYLGGSIVFTDSEAKNNQSTDIFTVSATYIIDQSNTISDILSQISALTTKTGNFKGSFSTYNALITAYSTGVAGDYAIVQEEDTIYVWNDTKKQWVNVYKETDLSNYLTETQINALLETKEDNISAKSGTGADNFYFSGSKTWVSLIDKVLGATLAGLVTTNSTSISETDTLLVALGKLQAQINTFIHPLSGPNEPTTALGGKIGQDYINTSNGRKYHLVAIENADINPSYVWEEYADVSKVNTLIQTAILDSWSAEY